MMNRTTTAMVALCAALGMGSVAEAQVYVQGSAQVQVQGQAHAHGGHAPAAAPAPAPTAGTVQGRGGFIGGELLVHGMTGDGAGAYGASLPLRWGWEFPSGLMPYLELGLNGTGGPGGFLQWFNVGGGGRWTFFNDTALAPFVGAMLGIAWVEDADGDPTAASFVAAAEGGLLIEVSKFTAITGAVRYMHFIDGSGVGYLGVGGGVVVFY